MHLRSAKSRSKDEDLGDDGGLAIVEAAGRALQSRRCRLLSGPSLSRFWVGRVVMLVVALALRWYGL